MTLPPAAALLLLRLTLAAEPATDPLDVSAVREKLVVVEDGQGHFLAVIPFGDSIWDHLYWSADGKEFYQQRVFGGGSNGTESFDRSFWEPRVRNRNGASFGMHEGTYKLWCGERTTVFKPLEPPKASAMVGAATFHPPRWKFRAYALARDDAGTYYYVDRLRDEFGGKGHRIFAGQKGAMKELPMTNIVSDSKGEIYSTKNGELRFVTATDAATWIKGGAKTELTIVPPEDNVKMIYGELGVYEGSLGTPCDDM